MKKLCAALSAALAFMLAVPLSALAEDNILIQKKIGFLTSDGNVSSVSLYGSKQADSPYYINLKVVVRDRKGNVKQKITPAQNSGYSPDIFLADFTGGGLQQVLLSVQSGGSGAFGYYYIYDLSGGRAETIFDYALFGEANRYTASYQNYYRVLVTDADSGERFMIDLSLRDKDYLEKIYRKDGRLTEPRDAYVSDLNTLYPVYNFEKKHYDIIALQRVTGLYNADLLGYITTKQSFQGGKFSTDYTLMGGLGSGG